MPSKKKKKYYYKQLQQDEKFLGKGYFISGKTACESYIRRFILKPDDMSENMKEFLIEYYAIDRVKLDAIIEKVSSHSIKKNVLH